MSQKQVSDIVKTIEANLRVDAPSFLAENIIHSIQDQIIAEFSSTQLDSATNYKEVQLAVEKKLADARAARLAAAPDKNITITSPADIDKLIREKRKEKNTWTTTHGAWLKWSSNTTYTDDEKEENKNIDQEIKKLKLWKTEWTEIVNGVFLGYYAAFASGALALLTATFIWASFFACSSAYTLPSPSKSIKSNGSITLYLPAHFFAGNCTSSFDLTS